jgi:hypothetical protein
MSWANAEALQWALEINLEKAFLLREADLENVPLYTETAGELLNVMDGLSYSISHLKNAVRLHNHEVNQKEFTEERDE